MVKFDREGALVERSPGEERVLAKGNSVERDFDKAGAPVREKTPVRRRPDEKEVPAERAR